MAEFFKKLITRFSGFIKFGISGGLSALITIVLLFIFTDILAIWYLTSSALAYSIAIVFNFLLQKFWAFRGNHSREAHHQFFLFFSVNIFNLLLNTVGMYLLVDKLHIWHILSQIITAIVLGLISFAFYKFVIFKKQKEELENQSLHKITLITKEND